MAVAEVLLEIEVLLQEVLVQVSQLQAVVIQDPVLHFKQTNQANQAITVSEI